MSILKILKIFFEELKKGKFIMIKSEKTAVEAVEKILSKIVSKKLFMNIMGDENKLEIIREHGNRKNCRGC